MRITQGSFSFLPDLTDEQITAQVEYCLGNGWAVGVEYTDDPHPRNTYWEMWGNPMFDLRDAEGVMMELNACRKAHGDGYIRLNAFDSTRGFETVTMSFIVNRPAIEPTISHDPAPRATAGRRAPTADQVDRPHDGRTVPSDRCARVAARADAVDLARRVRELGRRARCSTSSTPSWSGWRRSSSASARPPRCCWSTGRGGAMGLAHETPTLHMCFTGNPGTGKTTVALRMAGLLHRLGYVRKGHLVSVTRDDLVGQYIGHTAPKTKEVLKKAMGGVLFIDEAYYLYRPDNERDYGQEAIEILLQVMENNRDDLVVILAGYADRMERFFRSNPGFRSRIAHHIEFPDYSDDELVEIARSDAGPGRTTR